MATTQQEAEPVRRAAEMGHQVEHDPPAGLTRADRWTCKVCGDAVLIYGSNIYGSAVDMTCDESVAKWKRLGYM